MIASDLGLVVLAPRAIGGPALELDFVLGQYGRSGESATAFGALSGTSFSRAGAGTAYTVAGALAPFASGLARTTDRGLLLESARTNKVSCYNADPTDLTNIARSGDAAATLSVVDDTAALVAAGLSGVCEGGRAFRLDNTAGSGNAIARIVGQVGNTNLHTMSFWVRMAASGGQAGLLNGSQSGFVSSGPAFGALAGYARVTSSMTADTNSREMGLRIPAGAVAYFILMQIEEGASGSSPIVTAGTATTRGADVASVIAPGSVSTWSATYGVANATASGSVTPGATFDLVTGRPWLGVGNELKRLVMA